VNKSEAANLIDAIGESLRANPRQFNVQVNITGYMSTAHGGGTGTTIGTQIAGGDLTVSAGGGDVQIKLNAANAAIEKAVLDAAEVVHGVALELRTSRPTKSKIKSRLARLKELVPSAAALVTVVEKTLDLTGGLAP
jgi:hypothetical protein